MAAAARDPATRPVNSSGSASGAELKSMTSLRFSMAF
jgi:hypothetical protein